MKHHELNQLFSQAIRATLAAALGFLLTRLARAAEPGPTPPALSEAVARRVLDAAADYARGHEATPAIAVVDEAGVLVRFVRLDGNFPAASAVAQGKARTAALFRKPTREFEEAINRGRVAMTALTDFTPLQGGIPIVVDGRVIGAVGVSGARSAAQDEEVALAGARVVAPEGKNGAETPR